MPELPESDFVTAQTIIKHGGIAKVTDGGDHREFDNRKGGKTRKAYIGLRFNDGAERTWTMNKASADSLSKEWGTNTDAWVGKIVQFKVVEQLVGGEVKQVVIGSPKKEGA